MESELIISIISVIGIIIPSYLNYKSNRKIKKLECDNKNKEINRNVVDKLLDLTLLNKIQQSVNVIFDETTVEKFMILIAINGKTNFNTITCIFEQNKKYRGNAIGRMRNLQIDQEYKNLIRESELKPIVKIDVKQMKQSILKSLYSTSNVKYARLKHIIRSPIDNNNDALVFCSIATERNEDFNFDEEVIISNQVDSFIKPYIKEMINELK